MKAIVIKRFGNYGLGDVLDVKEKGVYHLNEWICDIPSQFFDEHFKKIENEP